MPNQSLVDLTARTATADGDLIHVNSGGTDYKQEKINFLKGDFQHIFNNTSALTAQVDALPVGTFFGSISAYGSQTATGLPINANCYVKATKMSATTASIEIWSSADVEGQHYITTKTSNTWGSWVHVPNRSEITALNNSLTNSFLIGSKTDTVSSIANFRLGGNTSEILVMTAWVTGANVFCIPFTDSQGNWYVKVASWNSSAWTPTTGGQITVNYLYKIV